MRPRGVTLLELLLLVTLLGIVTAIAVPSLRHGADRLAVRAARIEALRALDVARGTALRLGSPIEVTERGDRWVVRTHAGSDSTPLWSAPGAAHHGVTVVGLGAPIAFGASGVAIGVANRTLRLQRGQAGVAVVLSRLGRIR
jgi:Tfp pilus assembly protein FimT